MATTDPYLKITDTGASDVFNLWTGNNIVVMSKGRVIHDIGGGLVEDRIMIRSIQGATAVQVHTDYSTIIDYARKVRLYHMEPERSTAYWLEESSKNEIEAVGRKSLLYGIRIDLYGQGDLNRWLLRNDIIGEIVFTRSRWWEYGTDTISKNSTSFAGGTIIAGTVTGDLDGRITQIKISNGTNVGATYYVGIREQGEGYDTFNPTINCESISGTVANVTLVSDASYAGGTALQIDFSGDASMITRGTVTASEFSGVTISHLYGEYLVLISAKTTSTAVCRMQISGNTVTQSNPVVVSGAISQKLYEVGYIRFPAFSFRAETDLNYSTMDMFEIQAELASGAGNLILDYLIIMPSRHLLKVGPKSTSRPNDGTIHYFYTHPEGEQVMMASDSSGTVFDNFVLFEAEGFNILPDQCMFVFASDSTAGSASITADIAIDYTARWGYYYVT